MNETASDIAEIPLRGKVKAPFCCIGNEVFDVFLPIMGADCLAIYSWFARKLFVDPKLKHSVRDLADATALGVTTVSRSLEILEHLRLVKVIRLGGSRDSECLLFDSREVANHLGAKYHRSSLSFSLPPKAALRLKAEVKALRERQQGKSSSIPRNRAPRNCGNLNLPVSQRNTSVSPAIRQRSSRETQPGSHLIQQEGKNEKVPTPTPTPNGRGKAEEDKDSPDEDEPDGLLKSVERVFIGVMDNMRLHLLDTNKPPVPHLANGFADWKEFDFNSLAVEAAAWRGKVLVLRLSASDPAAARCGLDKYLKKWEASLHQWYGCEVDVELQQAYPKL